MQINLTQWSAFQEEETRRFVEELRELMLLQFPELAAIDGNVLDSEISEIISDARHFQIVTKADIAHFATISFEYGRKFISDSRRNGARLILDNRQNSPARRIRTLESHLSRHSHAESLEEISSNRT